MTQFLIVIIVYILSWGFLWISEIPQDIFRDQLLDEPKIILAIVLLAITVPVVAGIMPITNANQVARAISLSGSHVPQRFKSLVDKFGSDPAAMKQAGIAYATDQIIDLFANNVTNVHVYSMNKPDVAEKIQSNLSDILGK